MKTQALRPMVMEDVSRFVHQAARAYARAEKAPEPPHDEIWVERAIDAGVIGAVTWSVREAGYALPASAQQHRIMTAAVELAALQDLKGIQLAFHEASIPWAVMKGPVLSRVVYAVPGIRDYSDLDVLVLPQDLQGAVASLVGHGSDLAHVEWEQSISSRAAEVRLVMPGGTVLDLHWDVANLGDVRDAYGLSATSLLAARVNRDLGPVEVPTLSDVDFVLHVLFHGCIAGAHRLRWLLDAQQCLRWLTASPVELGERAEELHLSAPVRAMLDRTALHLDDRIGEWVGEIRAPRCWNAVLMNVNRRFPPSDLLGRRSGATWYSSTRPESFASMLALIRSGKRHVQHRRSAWPEPSPVVASVSDTGYQEWLRISRTGGGRS